MRKMLTGILNFMLDFDNSRFSLHIRKIAAGVTGADKTGYERKLNERQIE